MRRFIRRLIALEKRFAPTGPSLTPPDLVGIYIDAAAPQVDPSPIKWGTVQGRTGVFERRDDESEQAFLDRLIAQRVRPNTSVTIHQETRKPDGTHGRGVHHTGASDFD
jgi:hypothetical protein